MNSTHETSVPAAARPRRPRLRAGAVAALAVAGLAAVAGCQSDAAAGPAGSVTPTQAASTSSPPAAVSSIPASAPSSAAPSSAAPSSAAPSAPAATATLGQPVGIFAHGSGFGQVRPPKVDNGGDPTGLVTKITWSSWGGTTATGTGTSTYVAGNQPVAAGTPQTVTIVAFHLGTCDGKLMYQAVEWYFPQHGQAFSPTHYENVCAGTFVPGA